MDGFLLFLLIILGLAVYFCVLYSNHRCFCIAPRKPWRDYGAEYFPGLDVYRLGHCAGLGSEKEQGLISTVDHFGTFPV